MIRLQACEVCNLCLTSQCMGCHPQFLTTCFDFFSHILPYIRAPHQELAQNRADCDLHHEALVKHDAAHAAIQWVSFEMRYKKTKR